MLLAACMLPPERAVRSQAWALPALLLLSLPGPAGGPADWGYMLGRVGAAWTVGRLLQTGAARAARAAVLAPLAAILLASVVAALVWSGEDPGLHLRMYYTAVLGLAGAIAFYYALRLVERPARVPVLLAGMWPYYLAGISWSLAFGALRPTSGSLPAAPGDILFHGLVTHLPGDLLTCVVVAVLTGTRASITGSRDPWQEGGSR